MHDVNTNSLPTSPGDEYANNYAIAVTGWEIHWVMQLREIPKDTPLVVYQYLSVMGLTLESILISEGSTL